jgi:hypothetical protein
MQNVINEFEKFAKQNANFYRELYVGIASDPVDRLRNGHNVNENIPHIFWNQSLHTDMVRMIENYFLEKGCKGGPGGGDYNTCYIYMYKITNTTKE